MVLIYTRPTWEKVIKNIEDDLLAIINWLNDNNLFLNFDKSAIVLHSLSEHTLPTINEIKIYVNICQIPNKFYSDSVTIVKTIDV